MGMDVYGKKPRAKVGEYFRNSVWSWHPLWDYCETVAPRLTGKVEYGHSNNGDGLGARDASALARLLRSALATGHTAGYAETYKANLDALPDEPCNICAGTGKRAEAPEVGAGHVPCNGCEGKGKVRPFDTWYPFSVENVEEFAAFLEACGGFEIC